MCVSEELRTLSSHSWSKDVPLRLGRGDTVMGSWRHDTVVKWWIRSGDFVRCVMTVRCIIFMQDATQKGLKRFTSIEEVVWCVLEERSKMLKRYGVYLNIC